MLKRSYIFGFLVFFLIIILQGCHITNEPQPIIVSGDAVTLTWDPPNSSITDTISPIQLYKVYYRRRGEGFWLLIEQIQAENFNEITLNFKEYGTGMYEFAVRTVDEDGILSPFHTSIDKNAEPFGGWYLLWLNSN